MNRTSLVALLLSLVALSGCKLDSDVNRPCVLVKRCPDGGVCPVTEREVQEKTTSSRDFISFGATDCDDLTCVRDAAFHKDPDLSAPAKGYCSRPCAEGSACASSDAAMDKDPTTKLSCRALLLDLAISDPDAGAGLNVTEPFFCARGG